MPPPANPSDRRSQVAEATATLILSHGLEGVTVRGIAEATGFSTAIVSHYFADKVELLLFTYRAAARVSRDRLVAAETQPGTTLVDFLACLLPLDDEMRRSWGVWLAYWGRCMADSRFAVEQARMMEVYRALVATRLARDLPRLADEAADRAVALVTLVLGIATQAAFDPANFPPERQRALLADAVARLTA